jgi:tRNA nucleotidyltransferase (CCA-adding enzyme)
LRCALLDQAREQPGGEALLAAAYEGVHLVGGAVRDLLLLEHPRELDVLVEGEIEPLLRALGGEAVTHDRFGTASVSLEDARIDVARARRERYPHPGGLPVVEPASVAEDLLRRDFTVNAIAVRIDAGRAGEVHAAPGALEDLAAGRLRVLHDASFIDDPTRLLRLARYEARLRFVVEDHTAALAREAIAARALDTVSGARIGAELRLGLAEDSALGALQRMDELGILLGLGLHTPLPEKLAAGALALLPDDGRPGELLMALLCEDPAILDTFEFPAGERDRIVSSARAAPQIGDVLASDTRASLLHGALAGKTPEAIAIAAAQGPPGAAETARLWFDTLRHVRLSITGDDLLAAGVPSGPELGRRLAVALARRLDGELEPGPRAELAAAMEAGA